jgi:hypothetical protein
MLIGDLDVVTATARAIDRLNDLGVLYANLFSPLHEGGVADAMRRLTITARGESLGQRELEAVMPPVFGRYILVYSTDVDERRRAFAIRHGIGHVVGGHVTEPNYLSNRDDYMSHEERVADCFALADLVPFWMLDDLRVGRTSWGAIKQALCRSIRVHTLDWPEDRVFDRATLRLTLYREEGL